MSKTIILENVDKIITSGGTEVDLDNISSSSPLNVEIIAVGGGGAGGVDGGGGGGAGGLATYSGALFQGTYLVDVAGGSGHTGTYSMTPPNGNPTFMQDVNSNDIVRALGGGGGARCDAGHSSDASASYAVYDAADGGCGGGGMISSNQGGNHQGLGGTGSQGSDGGDGASNVNQYTYWLGAGGGGIGGNGSDSGARNGSYQGGAGGVGTADYSDWGVETSTGHDVSGVRYYGGGGGGAAEGSGQTPEMVGMVAVAMVQTLRLMVVRAIMA